MNSPDQSVRRQRLRELLAIPERNRTDAEWDEINELEIEFAPGNRESANDRDGSRRPTPSAPPLHAKQRGPQGPGRKPFKKPNPNRRQQGKRNPQRQG
jgi:hypothetical protein